MEQGFEFGNWIVSSPILETDSYKASHWLQYPPNTTEVYSYFEARSGAEDTVFFGLEYILNTIANCVVSDYDIDKADALLQKHFGRPLFNREGWKYIINEHNGCLPLEIHAVDEGTPVPPGNVLMTVRSTDPKCFWLTNYLETLLVQVWYPTTVATNSRECKRIILKALEKSGTPAAIDLKLHDFGFRGVTCLEQAGIGGAAHLVNFQGTDTLAALLLCNNIYEEPCAGFSIPASEHSTITSWGRENEVKAFENMLDAYPTGLVACVSDSYNIYDACDNLWGTQLHDKIMGRNGTLVIRPDSGDPHEVLPRILDILWDRFGGEVNDRGYKVLDSHVRIIQGDGVCRETITSILDRVMASGYSADNIGFGSGGGLLQKFNRDTYAFAFKCSSITVDGVESEVYKEPVGMSAKNSKRGKLALVRKDDGSYETVSANAVPIPSGEYLLKLRFLDGVVHNSPTFSEIRERAKL